LNNLFDVFLQSVQHVIDNRLLKKLQDAFPEWIWTGTGSGFYQEVEIHDAIQRVRDLLSSF
jgi:hypothetical protein